MAFLSCNLLMSRSLSNQCGDCPGNPPQPTSISSQLAHHLLALLYRPQPAWSTSNIQLLRSNLMMSLQCDLETSAASNELRPAAKLGPCALDEVFPLTLQRKCCALLGAGVCFAGFLCKWCQLLPSAAGYGAMVALDQLSSLSPLSLVITHSCATTVWSSVRRSHRANQDAMSQPCFYVCDCLLCLPLPSSTDCDLCRGEFGVRRTI